MLNAIRILTSFVSLIVVPIRSDPATTPRVVIKGMTPAESQATAVTLSLFDEAGLPLPVLEIRRHHDITGCNGFQGLHRGYGERSVIDICTIETGEFEQRTLTHELGHAWTEHFLTAQRKQEFQELRGWTWWLNYKQAKWEDNGAEQAAEIIVWAVSEHPVGLIKIGATSCKDLHDGYVTLTGREPLHGYTQLCKPSITTAIRS